MSMEARPVYILAFWIGPTIAAYINLAMDRKENCVPDEIKACLDDGSFREKAKLQTLPCGYCSLEELDDYQFCSGFTGDVNTELPDRTANPLELTCDDDYIVFLSAERQMKNPFQTPYVSPEELLAEFQTAFKNDGIELPDDFDWWSHIVTIYGTTYC